MSKSVVVTGLNQKPLFTTPFDSNTFGHTLGISIVRFTLVENEIRGQLSIIFELLRCYVLISYCHAVKLKTVIFIYML